MAEEIVFQYISHLKSLIELEREEQRKKVLNELRYFSGEEREKYGKAVLNLLGKILRKEPKKVVLRFGRRKEIRTDISMGDVVIASNGEPLSRGFEGVVVGKGTRYIDVEFAKLPDMHLGKVRVDLFYDDTSFRRMEENLENLGEHGIKAGKLIFGHEEVYESEYEKIKPFDRHLNSSQINAVSKALGSPDFFIIHGPFGTGKTRTLAEYILQEVERGNSVLATAESNVAVDNLVERVAGKANVVRVGHPSRISPEIQSVSLDSLMKRHEKYEELLELWDQIEMLFEKRDAEKKPVPSFRRGMSDEEILRLAKNNVRAYRGIPSETMRSMAMWIELNREIESLMVEAEKIEKKIVNETISRADVVLTTNSTAYVVERSFDIAVVDEASQATVPSILIPLNKAEKFVIAGDHRQLPPVVLSLQAKELERTLFEILIEKYSFKSEMLTVQYRCSKNIADFPSQAFYYGRIETHRTVERISLKDFSLRSENSLQRIFLENSVVFIDSSTINAKEVQKRTSKSFYNPSEIKIVIKVVDELLGMGLDADNIGVISPYDDQVRMLREAVECEVKTVDGFQGREKEVIVISFVRSNDRGDIGFLRDYRRLNVSITRAKRLLVMAGNSITLSSDPLYRRLISYVKQRGEILDARLLL